MNAFNIPALVASMEALMSAYPDLADDDVLRADMIEGCTNALEVMSVLALWDEETSANIDVLKARESLLKTRRQRMERSKEVVRATMMKVAEAAQQDKWKLPEATISLAKGRTKVEVTEPADVPDRFVKIERTPILTEIKAAIESGEFVPGCALTNGSPTIMVRRS